MHELKKVLHSKKDLGLLMVLFLMEFTRGAFFLTFLPLYAVNYLGLSVASAGLAVSLHYLVETIFKSAAGWQFDRRGHPVIIYGLLLGTAALLIMKLYPTAPFLMAGSALFGLGVSPVWLAVISSVAPVQMQERAARMGIVFTVWLIGCGSGPVVINFLIAKNYNSAFWLIIALWGIALFITLTALSGTAKTTLKGAAFSFHKEVSRMTQNQAVKKLLLPGMLLQTLAGGVLFPLLPLFAQNTIGLNPNQYAFLLLSGGGAAALSFLPMGRLADRISLKILLGIGFGMTAVSLALFSTARTAASAYLLAALAGFSYAAVLPAWNNLLAKAVPPERQATGWGVFATVEGMGIAIGPALGGMVAKYFGIPSAVLISITILAAMSLFYFIYPVEKLFAK